jgi:hypothetical protein
MSERVIVPPLSPVFKSVRDRFEIWRKHKKPADPIPQELWQSAVELCEAHPIYQVSRTLRLNYKDLKDRVQRGKDMSFSSRDGRGGFVALDFGASLMSSECLVEMEARNGSKMKIYFRGAPKDLDPVGLSRAFWRQGS